MFRLGSRLPLEQTSRRLCVSRRRLKREQLGVMTLSAAQRVVSTAELVSRILHYASGEHPYDSTLIELATVSKIWKAEAERLLHEEVWFSGLWNDNDSTVELIPELMVAHFRSRATARAQVRDLAVEVVADHEEDEDDVWDSAGAYELVAPAVAAMLATFSNLTTLEIAIHGYNHDFDYCIPQTLCAMLHNLQTLALSPSVNGDVYRWLQLTPSLRHLRLKKHMPFSANNGIVGCSIERLTVKAEAEEFDETSDAAGWHWLFTTVAKSLRTLELQEGRKYSMPSIACELPALQTLHVTMVASNGRKVGQPRVNISTLPKAATKLALHHRVPDINTGWSETLSETVAYVQRYRPQTVEYVVSRIASLDCSASYLLREGCRFFSAIEPLSPTTGVKPIFRLRNVHDFERAFDKVSDLLLWAESRAWLPPYTDLDSLVQILERSSLNWRHPKKRKGSLDHLSFQISRHGDVTDKSRAKDALAVLLKAGKYNTAWYEMNGRHNVLWPLDKDGEYDKDFGLPAEC